MTKFHISEDGRARPCRAEVSCTLIHGNTREEAYESFEKRQIETGGESFNTIQKENPVPESLATNEEQWDYEIVKNVDEVKVKRTRKRKEKVATTDYDAVENLVSNTDYGPHEERIMKRLESNITSLENARIEQVLKSPSNLNDEEFFRTETQARAMYNARARGLGLPDFDTRRIESLKIRLSESSLEFKEALKNDYPMSELLKLASTNKINCYDLYEKTKDETYKKGFNHWQSEENRIMGKIESLATRVSGKSNNGQKKKGLFNRLFND